MLTEHKRFQEKVNKNGQNWFWNEQITCETIFCLQFTGILT